VPTEISRDGYGQRYGPTVGDDLRLGDTNLWIRIEEDHVGYGDEPLWGYGKNIRSRMLQHQGVTRESELDVLIVGVVLLDPLIGVVKTNIGVKEGRIVGIGQVGGPVLSPGADLVVGPNTFPIMGYGLIATPGAIDSHVHLFTPQLIPVALSGGVTTLITAGFAEPPWRMEQTLRAFEYLPVNIGLQGSARAEDPTQLEPLIAAGAVGLKVHEDWGAYPEVIDAALRAAEEHDIAVSLHTDGLNEAGELEDTIAAIGGRTVHAYHVEGAGGGHVPDLIGLVREPSVICSSTTPTIPYGPGAAREHPSMILAVHGGSSLIAEDLEAALERVHPAAMAAEGPLHELGAISIINSDSQGMGRIGETVRRTWQLAHVMKDWLQTEAGANWPQPDPVPRPSVGDPVSDGASRRDNDRVLRYLAKYTVEPARTHGIEGEVGSLLPGRAADIVLWRPSHFGVKPELVLKSGLPAWGALGEGNASVPGSEPVRYGAYWGGMGLAAPALATTFVSELAFSNKIGTRPRTRRRVVAVRGTRGLRRSDLVANRATLPVEVDPVDGAVWLMGRRVAVDPVGAVPLSRRYLLS
jgi:urease subunit alpha